MESKIFLSNLEADSSMIRAVMEPASTNSMVGLIVPILFLMFFIILVACLMAAASKYMKSKGYRTLLSDIFVAGKVRQIAAEEKIDLDAEFERFKIWEKKDYLKGSDIDEAIAVNLRDKITDRIEAEIKSTKKLD